MEVTDILEPKDDGRFSRAFISRSFDATSHFETEMDDVLDIYTRITGKACLPQAPSPSPRGANNHTHTQALRACTTLCQTASQAAGSTARLDKLP